jgi:diguanylate cyclase (GGDEF)-like protein
VRSDTGQAEQFVLSISDISFIREAERQLEHLAFHDPLTGLGNRYLLDQRLMQELRLANGQQACLAILFIDLDGFKAINDSMGHHVGDKLIQEVARRIQSQIRRHDEAIRLGGDEFVVILPNLANQSDARLVAEKMLRQIAEPIQVDEHALRISASIGIASYPQDGQDLNTLLSAADSAMYAAKHQGKGRACAYAAEMTDYVRTRLQTEQSLHHALERQELQLYYQPVFHLNTGQLAGFEALLRWQHPVSGLLSPDQFIPVAEESGLIEPIGTWVLEQALQQIQIWQQMTQRPLFMAVNVSPRQFVHADFGAIVQQALQRFQLSGESLEIEITESMLQDFQRSKRIVEALRTLGCTVAIDDFGTGYSSVSLLRHLPVSRIKIDRSFVSALPGRAQDTGLVSAMLGMAHSLGLEVTAEGIETAEQAGLLAEMANMAAQGYYFERPQPAEFSRLTG